MKSILYPIPLVKQGLQECTQACATQILQYYGVKKTITEIKKEVPVYVSSDGKPLGSSLGHIAAYFIKLGFQTTLHIADIQIFDPSWEHLSNRQLINKLQLRQKHTRHPVYDHQAIGVIFDGYITFLKSSGRVIFPIISEKYLHHLLLSGPVYAVVSYQGLNRTSKTLFSMPKNRFVNDAIRGYPGTHAVIISGYRHGKFQLIDSDPRHYGRRWITADYLIAAFYLAQTDFDDLLITLGK